MTDIKLRSGLQQTEVLDLEATRLRAEQAGFTTFALPKHGVVDRASFFDAIRATFPLDPPLVGSRSWDALSDSLWEGLYAHESRRIAILWPTARTMATAALSEFETARQVLVDVASTYYIGDKIEMDQKVKAIKRAYEAIGILMPE